VLKTRIGGEGANFISGVLLGDRSSFSEDLTLNIRKTGVSHITAVSGMHVSILTLFLLYISNIFTKKRKVKAAFILIVLFLYMILTGMPPSVVRAVIMSGCSLIGVIISRKSNSLFMVSLAATVMLIVNPYLLYSASFMLSFISTASICLFFPVIKSKVNSGRFDTLFMTLIANFATLPYVLWNFHTYSWIGLLINLIIVPLVPFVFIGGGLTVVLGAVPVLGTIITHLTKIVTCLVLWIINYTSNLPFGQINYKLNNPLYILAYVLIALIIYCLLSGTLKIKYVPCIVAILLITATGIYFDYSKNSSFYIKNAHFQLGERK
jgi:competence protein ComEC